NNLSGMLSAGLPLTRALTVLEKQSTNKKLTDILRVLIDEINAGGTLSSGMSKFPKVFSNLFVSMVRSGEESGGLPRVLSEVGVTLKKSYDLNKKIKSAMIYPSVIIGVIILIGILMMIYVVPTLTATFKDLGGELPSSTKFIIWLSDSISNNIVGLILVIFFLVFGVIFLSRLKTTKRYFDYITLRIPVIGTLIKEMNSARTTRTMSSLLSSGVDMSRALEITEDVVQNVFYKKVIHSAIAAIEKGIPLSATFKDNLSLYPVMVGEMIEVGEETGKLSQMLIDVATFYETEVDNKTKNLATIIEPVIMIFIGGAVGFFAISMISPMYSVMDNIQ
ncbi:MAG: type II secretion system F family protein, partial [Candidatus Pacebacteria bacterium]|nr:type II secretion system F family protein [Candidatus Paceibacterota bacterium]